MTQWLFEIEATLAELVADGDARHAAEAEALREVLRLTSIRHHVSFDPESFNGPSDYVECLEALASLARPWVELGPFEVVGTRDALRFTGSVAGETVTFERPPITSDWWDGEVLEALNDALAARDVSGRFDQLHPIDSPTIVFASEPEWRLLERHPSRLVGVYGRIWAPARYLGERPTDAPELVELEEELALEPVVVEALTRHPRDPHLALRLVREDGTRCAILCDDEGRSWFAPQGAVDMAWLPDGETTLVLGAAKLEAWVWGENSVRARHDSLGGALRRVVVSACGRRVALLRWSSGGAWELDLLESNTLEVVATLLVGGMPVAFGLSDDLRYAACLVLEQPPTENGPAMQVGSFHYIDLPKHEHGSWSWNVEPEALHGGAPVAPLDLLPIRFEGTVAMVDLPGWGEVRQDLAH